MTLLPERFAAAILATAITDGRAAELLEALFDGAAVTLDAATDALIIIAAAEVQRLATEGGVEIVDES